MPRTPLTAEVKAERAEARKQARREHERLAKIEAQKSQRPVLQITINIEWCKSRMYGSTPVATATIQYVESDGLNGSYAQSEQYRARGCGYDKESTVVGQIFRDYLAYKLHRPEDWVSDDAKPYGISFYDGVGYYEQGIGIACYHDIARFIGGKMEHVASGKTFDVYRITFQQAEGAQS